MIEGRNFASKDPKMIAGNLEFLAKFVETVHYISERNNEMVCQQLSGFEQRMNRQMDDLRQEMLSYIDEKFKVVSNSSADRDEIIAYIDRKFEAMAVTMKLGLQMQNQKNLLHAISPPATTAANYSSNSNRAKLPPRLVNPANSLVAGGMSNSPLLSDSPATYNASTAAAAGQMITITPHPGFVIKTRKIMGLKEKVFINIFHHESIALEPLNAARTIMADSKPFLVMGETTSALDKDGHNCYTFNVGVSSDYFKLSEGSSEGEPLEIVSPASVVKIIHKINLKFTEFLDENQYSLPRLALGYKGNFIPPFTIPVPASHHHQGVGHVWSNSSDVTTDNDDNYHQSQPTLQVGVGIADINNRKTDRNSFASSSSNAADYDENNNHHQSTTTTMQRKMQRKSIFGDHMNSTASHLLNASMLEYIREECLDANSCRQLKQKSVNDPHILLGWQIALLDEEGKMITDIYVVTDVRKNMMSQTEYRLSKQDSDDLWLRLKRRGEAGSDRDDDKAKAKTNSKGQHDFRPLRKVLTIFDKVPAQSPSGGLQLIEETEESNRSIN